IISLIEQGKYTEAISGLKAITQTEPTAGRYAMLGLAYFRSEQYSLAVEAYEQALKSDPSNAEWKSLLEKCQQNVIAQANVSIPEVAYFEKEKLIAPSVVKPGSIPTDPLPEHVKADRMAKFNLFLGHSIGTVSTAIFEAGVTIWGALVGVSGKVWTH